MTRILFIIMVCELFCGIKIYAEVKNYSGYLNVDMGPNMGIRKYTYTSGMDEENNSWYINIKLDTTGGDALTRTMHSQYIAKCRNGEVRIIKVRNKDFDNKSALIRAKSRGERTMEKLKNQLALAESNKNLKEIELLKNNISRLENMQEVFKQNIEDEPDLGSADSQATLFIFSGNSSYLLASEESATIWMLIKERPQDYITDMIKYTKRYNTIKPEVSYNEENIIIKIGNASIIKTKSGIGSYGDIAYTNEENSLKIEAIIQGTEEAEGISDLDYQYGDELSGTVYDYRYAEENGSGRIVYSGKFSEVTKENIVKQSEQYQSIRREKSSKDLKNIERLLILGMILIPVAYVVFKKATKASE